MCAVWETDRLAKIDRYWKPVNRRVLEDSCNSFSHKTRTRRKELKWIKQEVEGGEKK